MEIEILNEMEKVLEENKSLEKLELSGGTLPKVFCRHILYGTRRSTSLSKMELSVSPVSWDCPDDGRLMCVRHMFCDSVGCSV